jgi:hypothetical protein
MLRRGPQFGRYRGESGHRRDGTIWPRMTHLGNHCAAAIFRSFDHLVGEREQRGRNGQPQGPGRLEIDHQLELGRLFDRQPGGFGAFQDLVDMARGTPLDAHRADRHGEAVQRFFLFSFGK